MTLDRRCRFETERMSIGSWKSLFTNPASLNSLADTLMEMLIGNVVKNLPEDWNMENSIEKTRNWILERDDESYVFLVELIDTKSIVGLLILSEKCRIETLLTQPSIRPLITIPR